MTWGFAVFLATVAQHSILLFVDQSTPGCHVNQKLFTVTEPWQPCSWGVFLGGPSRALPKQQLMIDCQKYLEDHQHHLPLAAITRITPPLLNRCCLWCLHTSSFFVCQRSFFIVSPLPRRTRYNAAMSSCEKASQWTVALAILEMVGQISVRRSIVSYNTVLVSETKQSDAIHWLVLWSVGCWESIFISHYQDISTGFVGTMLHDYEPEPDEVHQELLLLSCHTSGFTENIYSDFMGFFYQRCAAFGCCAIWGDGLSAKSKSAGICFWIENWAPYDQVISACVSAEHWQMAMDLYSEAMQAAMRPRGLEATQLSHVEEQLWLIFISICSICIIYLYDIYNILYLYIYMRFIIFINIYHIFLIFIHIYKYICRMFIKRPETGWVMMVIQLAGTIIWNSEPWMT